MDARDCSQPSMTRHGEGAQCVGALVNGNILRLWRSVAAVAIHARENQASWSLFSLQAAFVARVDGGFVRRAKSGWIGAAWLQAFRFPIFMMADS